MRGVRFALMALAALLAGPLDGYAQAQNIVGQIEDESSSRPVEGASVVLLDQRGIPAGPRSITNAEGRFQLQMPEAGIYRLQIQRIGYAQNTTLPFEIPEDAPSVTLMVKLVPQVIELDPITLEVRRREQLTISANQLDQFRYRAETGFGDYITKDEIGTRYPTLSFEGLLRAIPWARLDRAGGQLVVYTYQGSTPCGVKWWLDGIEVREVGDGSSSTTTNGIPVNVGRFSLAVPEQLRDLDPLEIEGMEMYRGPAETPAEFVWSPGEPFCAAVVVWTVRSRQPGGRGGGSGGGEGGEGAGGGGDAGRPLIGLFSGESLDG